MFDPRRYPPDWPAIRARIRARAEDRCEWCGVPNGVWICRWPFAPAQYDYWEDILEEADDEEFDLWRRPVRVVCTTAHLPGYPKESGEPAGLAFLCQRCHLNLDRPHHLAVQRENREKRRGQLRLSLEDAP